MDVHSESHRNVFNETNASASRYTRAGRKLTYRLFVIQHPKIARACGSGSKFELRIFEGEHADKDITFSISASYFLFATLEQSRPIAHGRLGIDDDPPNTNSYLTGTPVSGMVCLDRPTPAGYFLFPDLSIRSEGMYRLTFNLFEELKDTCDDDSLADADCAHPVESPNGFQHRLEVKTSPFTVFIAKKFPGLDESTELCRTLASQGCRVRIRRDVRLRKPQFKDGWEGYQPRTETHHQHQQHQQQQQQRYESIYAAQEFARRGRSTSLTDNDYNYTTMSSTVPAPTSMPSGSASVSASAVPSRLAGEMSRRSSLDQITKFYPPGYASISNNGTHAADYAYYAPRQQPALMGEYQMTQLPPLKTAQPGYGSESATYWHPQRNQSNASDYAYEQQQAQQDQQQQSYHRSQPTPQQQQQQQHHPQSLTTHKSVAYPLQGSRLSSEFLPHVDSIIREPASYLSSTHSEGSNQDSTDRMSFLNHGQSVRKLHNHAVRDLPRINTAAPLPGHATTIATAPEASSLARGGLPSASYLGSSASTPATGLSNILPLPTALSTAAPSLAGLQQHAVDMPSGMLNKRRFDSTFNDQHLQSPLHSGARPDVSSASSDWSYADQGLPTLRYRRADGRESVRMLPPANDF